MIHNMSTVKTKTGKQFSSDYLTTIPYPAQCFIRVFSDLSTVTTVFSNPVETVQLWFDSVYLAGYTKLIAIIPEDGAIKVCLAKE